MGLSRIVEPCAGVLPASRIAAKATAMSDWGFWPEETEAEMWKRISLETELVRRNVTKDWQPLPEGLVQWMLNNYVPPGLEGAPHSPEPMPTDHRVGWRACGKYPGGGE